MVLAILSLLVRSKRGKERWQGRNIPPKPQNYLLHFPIAQPRCMRSPLAFYCAVSISFLSLPHSFLLVPFSSSFSSSSLGFAKGSPAWPSLPHPPPPSLLSPLSPLPFPLFLFSVSSVACGVNLLVQLPHKITTAIRRLGAPTTHLSFFHREVLF